MNTSVRKSAACESAYAHTIGLHCVVVAHALYLSLASSTDILNREVKGDLWQ